MIFEKTDHSSEKGTPWKNNSQNISRNDITDIYKHSADKNSEVEKEKTYLDTKLEDLKKIRE